MRRYFAVAMFAALSGLPAHAQVMQACKADWVKYCANSNFGDCMKVHFEAFSGVCKTALVKVAAISSACSNDVAQQCPSIKPGSGRILLCVKSHYSALSYECRTAVGQALQNKLQAR